MDPIRMVHLSDGNNYGDRPQMNTSSRLAWARYHVDSGLSTWIAATERISPALTIARAAIQKDCGLDG